MSTREDRGCQDLIAQLNENLAGEYRVIAGYDTVIALLHTEVTDRQGHALALADSVTALGGQPSAVPPPLPVGRDPREVLEQLLSLEASGFAVCREWTPYLHQCEDTALLTRRVEPAAGEAAPRHAAP